MNSFRRPAVEVSVRSRGHHSSCIVPDAPAVVPSDPSIIFSVPFFIYCSFILYFIFSPPGMWSGVRDFFDFSRGSIDILVVPQEDGTYASTPFHIRFGRGQLLREEEKIVRLGHPSFFSLFIINEIIRPRSNLSFGELIILFFKQRFCPK